MEWAERSCGAGLGSGGGTDARNTQGHHRKQGLLQEFYIFSLNYVSMQYSKCPDWRGGPISRGIFAFGTIQTDFTMIV